MKKLLLVILLAMAQLPLVAENRDRAIIVASSNDRFQLETLSRIGYGYHFVKSAEFKPSGAGEFFFNFVQIDYFPTDFLEIQFGLDCEFNHFSSKYSRFILDDHYRVQVEPFPEYSKTNTSFRGGFRYFNINAPLLVKGIIGYLQIGLGAEVSLNVAGKTFNNLKVDNTRTQFSESKIALNRFSFGLVGGVTFDDFGLYVKYYPRASRNLVPGSVEFTHWTLGFTFGL